MMTINHIKQREASIHIGIYHFNSRNEAKSATEWVRITLPTCAEARLLFNDVDDAAAATFGGDG
jgi:GH25 family lysozyme M1 (1,4-beta-N-acetylmuramidase)